MIYLVIAYRWGWLNGHQYIVHASTDREAALEAAEAEADDRAGKYAMVVTERDGEAESRIHYIPSSYGEANPSHNHRIDMFQSLGSALHDWVEEGFAMLPNPDRPGTLSYVKVEDKPPQWLIEAVKKKIEMEKFMADLRNGKVIPEIIGIDMAKEQ